MSGVVYYIFAYYMLCFQTKFGTSTDEANVFSEGTVFSSFVGLLRNPFLGSFHRQYSLVNRFLSKFIRIIIFYVFYCLDFN